MVSSLIPNSISSNINKTWKGTPLTNPVYVGPKLTRNFLKSIKSDVHVFLGNVKNRCIQQSLTISLL